MQISFDPKNMDDDDAGSILFVALTRLAQLAQENGSVRDKFLTGVSTDAEVAWSTSEKDV